MPTPGLNSSCSIGVVFLNRPYRLLHFLHTLFVWLKRLMSLCFRCFWVWHHFSFLSRFRVPFSKRLHCLTFWIMLITSFLNVRKPYLINLKYSHCTKNEAVKISSKQLTFQDQQSQNGWEPITSPILSQKNGVKSRIMLWYAYRYPVSFYRRQYSHFISTFSPILEMKHLSYRFPCGKSCMKFNDDSPKNKSIKLIQKQVAVWLAQSNWLFDSCGFWMCPAVESITLCGNHVDACFCKLCVCSGIRRLCYGRDAFIQQLCKIQTITAVQLRAVVEVDLRAFGRKRVS